MPLTDKFKSSFCGSGISSAVRIIIDLKHLAPTVKCNRFKGDIDVQRRRRRKGNAPSFRAAVVQATCHPRDAVVSANKARRYASDAFNWAHAWARLVRALDRPDPARPTGLRRLDRVGTPAGPLEPRSGCRSSTACSCLLGTAIPVAGPLIQPKALRYAQQQGPPFEVGRPVYSGGPLE
jgi:hypothetical protein